MGLFSNKNKRTKTEKKEFKDTSHEIVKEDGSGTDNLSAKQTGSSVFSGSGRSDTHKILQGFYISEKASMGAASDQYMFRVFKNANKSEIKKEVSGLFNVKVKKVKILNMPEKRRDFGRHPGSRSEFKKAVVVLEKGYTIGQAR